MLTVENLSCRLWRQARPARRDAHGRGRRIPGRAGPQRLRQDDAAAGHARHAQAAAGMRSAGRPGRADHRQTESRPHDGLSAAGPGDRVGLHRPRVGLDGPQPAPFAFRAGIGRRSPRGGAGDAVGRRAAPGRAAGHGPQRRRAAAGVDRHVPGPAAEDPSARRADQSSRSGAPVVDSGLDRPAESRSAAWPSSPCSTI